MSPIRQPDDLVEVHFVEVRSHAAGVRLALVEHQVGEAARVAGEIHVTVVIRSNIGFVHQRGRQRVGFQAAVAGMHGYGDEACVVVALQQFALEAVRSDAPVGKRQVPILLQLVAQAPEHYGRMVAVALDELRNVFLPQGRPLGTSAAVLVEPFVVKLVDHQNAVFVTQIHEAFAVGVVRGTDMVHAERFQQLNAFLDGTVVCRRAQRTQRMMVGDAFQQHFLSVELHAEGGRELYRAHAEVFAHAVCHRAVFVIERHLHLIQMRTFAVPQTGICQPDRL